MQYENFPVSYQCRRKDPAVAFFKIIKDSLPKHFNQTTSPQQSFLSLPYSYLVGGPYVVGFDKSADKSFDKMMLIFLDNTVFYQIVFYKLD